MIALLSSAYLAPVQYYSKLYAAHTVWQDVGEHYLKQSYRTRCVIAGAEGPTALSIPVERRHVSQMPMRDVRLSDHGHWQRLHWQAITSAYEGSPFFEYYADYLRPIYTGSYSFLVDFNEALRSTICNLIDLEPHIITTEEYANAADLHATDYRTTIHPKHDYRTDPTFRAVPYYQVFASRHGFLPNLSILDLLFCMGPESLIVLRDSCVTAE